MSMFVIDASVLIKLFKIEDHSDTAAELIDWLVKHDRPALAPSIALYETLAAGLHVNYPFALISELLARLRRFGFALEEPTQAELGLSEKIAGTPAQGGGYPTLFDSIYHAMAIERGGTFLTADRRHVEKTAHLGHVTLLSDWRPK